MSMDREDHEMIAALIDRTFKARTPEEIREQRRYEIARDIFVGFTIDQTCMANTADRAEEAVRCAEFLLTELERTK